MSPSGVPQAERPLASYLSLGADAKTSLGASDLEVWADVGAAFSVQSAISGSTGERWYSGYPALNLTAPLQANVQYFHQFLLTYDFTAVGGNMTVPPTITGMIGGKNSHAYISRRGGP